MIERDQALRLQAWVDGELTARETCEVETWVRSSPEARALADELQRTKGWIASCEFTRTLPESRDFYWSGIAKGILAGQAASPAVADGAWRAFWQRWWVPAGALALLAVVATVVQISVRWGHTPAMLAVAHEVETPLAGVSAFTFYSESAHMTVVWVDFHRE
jgi:hypothetical protein